MTGNFRFFRCRLLRPSHPLASRQPRRDNAFCTEMPRREIYLGMTKLEEHLRQAGIRAPFVLTDLLDTKTGHPSRIVMPPQDVHPIHHARSWGCFSMGPYTGSHLINAGAGTAGTYRRVMHVGDRRYRSRSMDGYHPKKRDQACDL